MIRDGVATPSSPRCPFLPAFRIPCILATNERRKRSTIIAKKSERLKSARRRGNGTGGSENGRHFEAFVARDGSKGCSPVVTGGEPRFQSKLIDRFYFLIAKVSRTEAAVFYHLSSSSSPRRERIATLFSPGLCLTSQAVTETEEWRMEGKPLNEGRGGQRIGSDENGPRFVQRLIPVRSERERRPINLIVN